jgi:hypothetical protein
MPLGSAWVLSLFICSNVLLLKWDELGIGGGSLIILWEHFRAIFLNEKQIEFLLCIKHRLTREFIILLVFIGISSDLVALDGRGWLLLGTKSQTFFLYRVIRFCRLFGISWPNFWRHYWSHLIQRLANCWYLGLLRSSLISWGESLSWPRNGVLLLWLNTRICIACLRTHGLLE